MRRATVLVAVLLIVAAACDVKTMVVTPEDGAIVDGTTVEVTGTLPEGADPGGTLKVNGLPTAIAGDVTWSQVVVVSTTKGTDNKTAEKPAPTAAASPTPLPGENPEVKTPVMPPAQAAPPPTPTPTAAVEPTPGPVEEPTPAPSEEPTVAPGEEPTVAPSEEPTPEPTVEPAPDESGRNRDNNDDNDRERARDRLRDRLD